MPSETHDQVAASIRHLAAQGRYHGKSSELVKMFDVEFTEDGIRQVQDALAAHGLASKPPLVPGKPKTHVTVVITGGARGQAAVRVEEIEIFAGEPGRPYRVLGAVQARVTAATAFSKTPTVEDVNLKLREQAVRHGANAVINVTYSRGVSATSWKALTADGTAVVATASGTGETAARAPQPDPVERIRQLADLLATGAITEEEYTATKRKLLDQIS